jgi:hypothetical protein
MQLAAKLSDLTELWNGPIGLADECSDCTIHLLRSPRFAFQAFLGHNQQN